MSLYTFKYVPASELHKLQAFIDSHWKKNHCLAISRELMDFQHYNSESDSYNFIVAENNQTKEYDAIVGFIPTSQFDPSLASEGDYWGAIWKIRDDVDNPEINAAGFYIWKSLLKLPGFHSYAAIAISDIAKRIYKIYRINLDYLRCYYMLNPDVADFRIADNVAPEHLPDPADSDPEYEIKPIADLRDVTLSHSYKPKKTIPYLINRYKNHPFYHYDFYGIYRGDELKAILITRTVAANGSTALRIVDVYGKLDKYPVGDALRRLLREKNAEYIDILNYGIPSEIFAAMGFRQLDFDGPLVIPNYFEPFERRNVKIDIAYKSDHDYIAFKGDSDQDRPNLLRSLK